MRGIFVLTSLFVGALMLNNSYSNALTHNHQNQYTVSATIWADYAVDSIDATEELPIHIIDHVIYVPYTPETKEIIQYEVSIDVKGHVQLSKFWGNLPHYSPWKWLSKSHVVLRYNSNNGEIPLVIFDGPVPYIAMNTKHTPDLTAQFANGKLSFFTEKNKLPNVYSIYDHIDASQLIRNQGSANTCWAFAVNSIIEIEIAKKTGAYYNLSEEHLIEYSPIPVTSNSGGNFQIAFAYYQNNLGPVREIDSKKANIHVNGYEVIHKNIHKIKNKILTNGAVLASLYFDTNTPMLYNANSFSYYNPHKANRASHDVIIVGWDDDYSKENFDLEPRYNGAFLVQNSFGTQWGDNGLFYVSYEDAQLTQNVYAITQMDLDPVDLTVYTHAPTGVTHYDAFFDFSSPNVFSKFTAQSDGMEILHAVGFYNDTHQAKVEIFYTEDQVNITPIAKLYNLQPGYTTYYLKQPIDLIKNKNFLVGIQIGSTSAFSIPIEAPYPNILYDVTSERGQGYVFDSNLGAWTDLYDYRPMASLSLTAYTTNKTPE